ncbi:histidine kinase dimerization/phosphoacceptor domain -containing protein [Gracilibacillus timonensis]|uniref:histidine kinase dimerization/phosphoacceptor domain -containing protein n=1 Tax=Gracilibacillus timonensis TaxID=1816696 RepID=UPI0008240112|nr:histidine kinase dimerization/phosphoacceptor domain -containing protein [Gracilibacillus timonensis]
MKQSLLDMNNFIYLNSPKGIQLSIEENEIHSLMMKDSSEQEQFMKALQFTKQNDGNIYFMGNKVTALPHNYDIWEHYPIEFLYRHPLTLDNLTVAENVHLMYLPKYRFMPFLNRSKIHKNTIDIFNKLGLDYNPKEKLYNLSAEDKKFIYLCRLLLLNPKLIIMHEPIENLSSTNAAKMYNIIRQFKEMRGSVLFITRQWENSLKIGDSISILNNGVLAGKMTASEAKADPQLFLRKIEGYYFKENDRFSQDSKSFLDTVFKAAEFLTSEYELKDVLLLLAKEVCQFMGSDGCAIQLLDENTWHTIDKFEYQELRDIHVQLTKETIIKIAQSNEIFYINRKDKEFNTLFKEQEGMNTFICIPILIRSQVTGLISLYYKDFYIYSKAESQYLFALAKHVAIAIEDTRLMGRSTLLQESHHRIKNNLQSVIGLVTLQKNVYKQDNYRSIDELLDNVISRIKSIATVHDLLSKDRMGRSIINLKELIESIIEISSADPKIQIKSELEDIFIPYNKATSIALIINELVINSQKHAFKNRNTGIILIHSYKISDWITISVTDNGEGMPADFDLEKTDSLGLNIIKDILKNELQGDLEMGHSPNNGSSFTVSIPSKVLFGVH